MILRKKDVLIYGNELFSLAIGGNYSKDYDIEMLEFLVSEIKKAKSEV